MSKISMSGYGRISELCEKLEKCLDDKAGLLAVCELLESTHRRIGGTETAVLLFKYGGLWGGRYDELFTVSLYSDGEAVAADVLTRSAKFSSNGDKLALLAADALRELGFEEYERESWRLEAESKPAEPEAFEQYGDYLSPSVWRKAASEARERSAEARSGPEPAEPEQRRSKRGKRSYDPEI